ncbi:MAG: ArnT family glycosyltransferase [Thermodesulfobacteriota bacterium]
MDKSFDYRGWGAVLFIILVAAVIRLNMLSLPLERDEGVYAYIGQLVLHGLPPYKYAVDMRLPGLYLVYALILKVFGQTNVGVHAGLIFVNAGTCVLLFLLGRRLLNSFTGVIAAGSFAVLSLSSSVLGAMTHPEHFVMFFAVAGAYLLAGAPEDGGRYGLKVFLSGLLLGTGMLMKQHGMLFIFFGGIYLAITLLRRRPFRSKPLLARLGVFSAGSALPYIFTCLILLLAGVFDDFWFSTVTYARAYVDIVPLGKAFLMFKARLLDIMAASSPIWVLAGAGLTAQLWYKEARKRFLFLTLFFIFSLLAVLPGLYFRRHYFILLLPAVAMLAAVGADSLRDLCLRSGRTAARSTAIVVLAALAVAYPIYHQRGVLFPSNPEKASRMIYGANPFPESQVVARYIKEHSGQDDKIAILGSEPQILFYSQRLSATRYIYTYPLMEGHRFALGMQREMIREIEEAKPLYLVFVQLQVSWLMRPESKTVIFDWFRDYQTMFYERVGVVDMIPGEETRFYWDGAAGTVTPQSNNNIFVYRRKAGL